ncbi:MAG: hypothetical protein JO115_19495 [Pseudonocardiales bacterium]|nr:hypothetical protein [Pseudonocardiales bacterium]
MTWHATWARIRILASALDRDGAIARAVVLASDRDLNLDLTSAVQVAGTLASALDLDRAHVLDQARALAGDLVRDLTSALDSDHHRHRDRAVNRAAVTARDLARALDLALGGVLDRHDVPDRAAGGDLDLTRDLASALASYHALLCALANYPTLDRDRNLAADFTQYRNLAHGLACCLDRHSAGSVTADAKGGRSMPRMVRVAVRLLPRSWQTRYREEYRAELAQLCPSERYEYARRVLAGAWQLRRALAGTECPPDRVRVER